MYDDFGNAVGAPVVDKYVNEGNVAYEINVSRILAHKEDIELIKVT